MPRIQWTGLPPALRDHLFDRLREREITAEDLYQLKAWRESEESVFVEPLYRFVDGENGEISVFPDKVVFAARSSWSEDERPTTCLPAVEISRRSLIAVMNRKAPEEWAPDIVVVLYRNAQGALDYFVYPIVEKDICRKVSEEIYKIIDNGFLKSVLASFYVMTHPIKGVPWLYK